jgi:hypothetical protein
METLFVTTNVSSDGQITVPAPGSVRGEKVQVQYKVKRLQADEPVDEYGYPIGFWEKLAADPITDPAFKRYPQPEADPPPSFE